MAPVDLSYGRGTGLMQAGGRDWMGAWCHPWREWLNLGQGTEERPALRVRKEGESAGQGLCYELLSMVG